MSPNSGASKEVSRDEKSLRPVPIGGSGGSLGKVKMSDSYATIAFHSANTLTGSRQQDSHLTAGDRSRTINSQLGVVLSVEEKDSSKAERGNRSNHDSFLEVFTHHTTSADDKRFNSIEPQEDEESLEVGRGGFEQVEVVNSSTPAAESPVGIRFWPKCCSTGEILYVPSPPLRPVCELFEGPHLARPSLLQGLGLRWGRDGMSGGLPLSCKLGEQVEIY